MDSTNEKVALRKPDWLIARAPAGEKYEDLKSMMLKLKLATVCQSARCPNIGECWRAGTATIMLMGDVCTRGCRFCNVKTGNPRGVIDHDEPQKVGYAIGQMNLDYVVLTSVDRDDLPDQGADHFARTIRVIKETNARTLVEVLTPDFRGNTDLVKILVDAQPDVFAHNIETVERLSKRVRDPRAGYRQSLDVLKTVKSIKPNMKTKSSIMLGLGEETAEVEQALRDLRAVGCDVVTFGQYLQPSKRHLPVISYVTPAEFADWKAKAEAMGFLYVASGPLVRSSYRAGEFYMKALVEKDLAVENWDLVDYKSALQKQTSYASEIRDKKRPSTLVFCRHHPVVTKGRKTNPNDLGSWAGEIYDVNRGGSVTYHGPSQIVGYPLLDLEATGTDAHRILRLIEASIVCALKEYGIEARGRQSESASATGVWVGEKKVASIGIGISQGVSLHGFALNVDLDESAFEGIQPCGFRKDTMTCMETILNQKVDRQKLLRTLESAFRIELRARR